MYISSMIGKFKSNIYVLIRIILLANTEPDLVIILKAKGL